MRRLHLHPLLALTAMAMVGLTVVAAAGLFLDERMLVGVPIWLKPLKFAISIAVYTGTLAWLVPLVRRGRRAAHWLGTAVAVGLLLEIVIIMAQAVRGRQSHFNQATPLDATLFTAMGATITMVWVVSAVIAGLVLRDRIADRATTLAIRVGLLVALAGMAVGFLMTMPTPAQRAEADPVIIGAHSVGVPDGGPGLPLVNWSTEGGDLRVGHFVGLHALQALPLLAGLLTLAARRLPRLRDDGTRARLIAVAGAGYAGLTGLVTWQALRGQSLVHPDPATLAVGAALALAVAIGVGWGLHRITPGTERRVADLRTTA